MFSLELRRIRSLAVAAGVLSVAAAPSRLQATTACSPNLIQYTAAGTFGDTPVSGMDSLRLAGEPFSIALYACQSKTPTSSGPSDATYTPIDYTGAVTSALLGGGQHAIQGYASIILIAPPVPARDTLEIYAPVKVLGNLAINIHAVLSLPEGTLPSTSIAAFNAVNLFTAADTLTYSTSTGSTTLAIASGTLSAQIPVMAYSAVGTFAATPTSGNDGLRLSGEPFSIVAYASESKTPSKSGGSGGNSYAIYGPLDLSGTVQSALLPTPTNIGAYASLIMVQTPSGRDQIQLYAPVQVEGTVNIHGILLLPPGTLSSLSIAPFSPTDALPAGSLLTYSNTSGTTTLGIQDTVVKATYYTPAAAQGVPALHANAIQEITRHADGTQSVRSLRGAPVELGTASDTTILQFYASGVRDTAQVRVRIAGQEAKVVRAQRSEGFAGLNEIQVEVPRNLAGAGDVTAVMISGGEASEPLPVRIR